MREGARRLRVRGGAAPPPARWPRARRRRASGGGARTLEVRLRAEVGVGGAHAAQRDGSGQGGRGEMGGGAPAARRAAAVQDGGGAGRGRGARRGARGGAGGRAAGDAARAKERRRGAWRRWRKRRRGSRPRGAAAAAAPRSVPLCSRPSSSCARPPHALGAQGRLHRQPGLDHHEQRVVDLPPSSRSRVRLHRRPHSSSTAPDARSLHTRFAGPMTAAKPEPPPWRTRPCA